MAERRAGRPEFDAVIVSPNAAVDSYYILSRFEVGRVNRAAKVMHTAGGKGINMARALTRLGGRALALGIVGGRAGQFIVAEMDREGIAHDCVWIENETRRCSTLVVPDKGETTVALESGSPVGQSAADQLQQRALYHAPRAPFLSITGSLPPELPADYYARLIDRLVAVPQAKVCLDSAGETLKLAAEAGPHIIKVNWHEFQSAFGDGGAPDWKRVRATFALLAQKGLEVLIITDGPNGAYVFAVDAAPFQVVTRLNAWVSTVGAGDTFMAGLLLALGRGDSLESAACFASAAAAANLQQAGCGFLDEDDVERFLPRTGVSRLPV